MSLSKKQVFERVKRCRKLNLCYITLQRLEDEEHISEIEYEPGIFVKILSRFSFIKF